MFLLHVIITRHIQNNHSIFANIYQDKVDNVILSNSNLCMHHENKILMFNFRFLNLKQYESVNNFFLK